MNYIFSMDVVHLYNLVNKAKEKTEREELYQFYCNMYPYFEEAYRIPFNEYIELNKKETSGITMKSDDEIMSELLNRKE